MFNTAPFLKLSEFLADGIPEGIMEQAVAENEWFTPSSIDYAAKAIREKMLDRKAIEKWLSYYPSKNISDKKVGIIMAGNIPFVGFFDFMCVVVTGAAPYIKYSSKDRVLMSWIVNFLKSQGIKIKELTDDSKIDALISMGGETSSRIFRKKYAALPLLIRSSRTSVAIIESGPPAELWNDVFLYYGLGCRNVTHLLLKKGVDIEKIAENWSGKKIDNQSFLNSVKQRRALLIMAGETFIDGGYFILKRSDNIKTSIGEISYSYFDTKNEIKNFIGSRNEQIQCVVGDGYIPFGKAQKPELWDYSDGVDTVAFLQSL